VRKVLAEAAQDREAVRVEVTPIVQGLLCKAWEGSDQVDSVAAGGGEVELGVGPGFRIVLAKIRAIRCSQSSR
jgi:hypothetical protein